MTTSPIKALGAFAGFVAMSAIAAVLVVSAVTPALAVTSLAVSNTAGAFDGLPDYLAPQPLDQTTTFYAKQGSAEVAIATFYAQNREDVAWDAISQSVKDAAVATEDPRFYSEGGIDLMGTVRGALSTASDNGVQGGSSITQQYVKNILVQRCEQDDAVDPTAAADVQQKQQDKFEACYRDATGVTIQRKVQEIRYAIGLDKRYSKNDILLSYLNIVGFGGQVYGVEAAAEYYFDMTAAKLTLPQAATLVAILNNPNYLRIDDQSIKPDDNALDNTAKNGYAAAKERRDYVLERMLVNHKISKPEYTAAVATKVEPHITPKPSGCTSAVKYDAGFFCDYVQRTLLQNPAFGKTAEERQSLFQHGGLKVYTTLNLGLQNTAQSALSSYIPPTYGGLDLGGANVSMEVGTGRIVTMVENKQFNDTDSAPVGTTSLNYTTDYAYGGSNGFQTGSSFKAFDLVAWLESGHHLYDTINANVHSFPESQFATCGDGFGNVTWNVANDESSEGGYMSVLQATEASVNTAFAMMATKLNLCDISKAATSLGAHSANPAPAPDGNPWTINPPMVIGTNYIAPLSMAQAYAGIANGGVSCTPVAIDSAVDSDGKALPVPKTQCTQAIPKNVAATVTWALEHVLTDGTATGANPWDGEPIMGKTGTTDYAHENWLVTSTPKVAQATWVGLISGSTDMHYVYFKGIQGNNVKFNIVKTIQTALDQTYRGGAFPAPDQKLIGSYSPPVAPKTTTPSKGQNGNGGTSTGTATNGNSTPGKNNGPGGTGANPPTQGNR
ncbi:transglycosylase domain-containing protein [Humibacter ginsenosidimutans]|uniref:Penicillin-binding protein n=1 Tax=Humibacter ginsenosidimutans TaxID=2599293 RepID=A0A5B8M735_9MICO|nr:transglycosylase domain-containing protein [Humibacter ginsenosidimutans]QDZ16347.1 penicillin-binding protein [Humibacter ginsenosidimutans]